MHSSSNNSKQQPRQDFPPLLVRPKSKKERDKTGSGCGRSGGQPGTHAHAAVILLYKIAVCDYSIRIVAVCFVSALLLNGGRHHHHHNHHHHQGRYFNTARTLSTISRLPAPTWLQIKYEARASRSNDKANRLEMKYGRYIQLLFSRRNHIIRRRKK